MTPPAVKPQALNTAAIAHQRQSVSAIMLHVMVALLPGIALYALLIDSRLLGNLALASLAAVMFEAALVGMRKRPVMSCLKDGSIVLAAILLVLSVPQGLPAWQLLFGVFILCTLGKHVFGGLGQNPFNPAMVAYAVLIISFPLTMTQWSTDLGYLDTRSTVDERTNLSAAQDWNSITSATPLDRLHTLKRETKAQASGSDSSVTMTNNDTLSAIVLDSDWIWLSVAWLLGGLYLLFMRIISWHIPVTVLGTLWILYTLYDLSTNNPILPASIALLSGAIMIGAFFIATDPVSAATSNPGKLVYGVGIGLFCFVIREFSVYPEGFAFAVLLMNMCVPLIDHSFTRNSVKTHSQRHHDGPEP